jgi:DNA-binding response OmpR family regulator
MKNSGMKYDAVLVEDNPLEAHIMLMAFRRYNPQKKILWLDSSEKALNYLTGESARKNNNLQENRVLVLLDLYLPKISGFEIMQEVKKGKNGRSFDFVVITGSDSGMDKALSYQFGVKAYINKNIVFENCIDTMCGPAKENVINGFFNVLNEDESGY